jgi:hypothetical protein
LGSINPDAEERRLLRSVQRFETLQLLNTEGSARANKDPGRRSLSVSASVLRLENSGLYVR